MRNGSALCWTALGVNAFGWSTALLVLAHASRGDGDLVPDLVFAVWISGPFFVLLGLCTVLLSWKVRLVIPAVVILLGSVVVSGFGMIVYIDAFFIHLDPQNGLAFVFVPIYQWGGVIATVAVLAVSLMIQLRKERSRR